MSFCLRWIERGISGEFREYICEVSSIFPANYHSLRSIVEFLPIADGQYRIIGTSLINPAFLFLRYDTGDIATLQEGTCPCGRLGRLVKEIDGRKEDYVILPNGAIVGRLDHIFKDLVNIREAQIYQKQQCQIELRIVKGQFYTDKDEQELLKETRKRVGDDMEIVVRYVDAIERTQAGKLRFVVSELKEWKSSIS